MKNNTVQNILEMIQTADVEWYKLGDVTDYEQPTKYLVKSTNYNDDFDTPVLTAGKTFILGYTNETDGIYKASTNPVIIFDDFTTANKWVDFDFKAKSSAMKMITSKDETKYLLRYIYHWLNNLPNEQIDGDHKRQWISNYSEKLIPFPKDHNIQTEIVRILDAMTSLTAELTAELTQRKSQYQYYRDYLFDFDKQMIHNLKIIAENTEMEWKTLGDLTLPTSNIKWKNNDNSYRYIDLTSVSRENNSITETLEINAENAPSRAQKLVKENDVIFATTRPAQQRVTLINKEFSNAIASTGYCILRADNEIVLPKWIYYNILSTNFKNYVEEHQSGSAYPAISDSKVKEFKIPIPPLPEQARIVAILDKFDTLANSISEGLPKEIELRQKQYGYYRDLLLGFSEQASKQ